MKAIKGIDFSFPLGMKKLCVSVFYLSWNVLLKRDPLVVFLSLKSMYIIQRKSE